MNHIAGWVELRSSLVSRGRDLPCFILPEEQGRYNPEGQYVITRLADGRIDVTLSERNDVYFNAIYPDDATAIAALDQRIRPVIIGPPIGAEQMAWAKRQGEIDHQQMLAQLEEYNRSAPPADDAPRPMCD